ncbi:MAG: sensor histidine kinase [Bacteroidota bacterium]
MLNSGNPDFLLIFSVGTALMIFMAGSIVFFVIYYQKRMLQNKMEQQAMEGEYQRKLLKITMDSQEAERKRIASELHDGVGAMLSAAKLNLNFLKSSVPEDNAAESISEMKDIIDETIDTVRRISKDLLPASLEKFGLVEAVKEFCEKVTTPATRVVFEFTSGEFQLPRDEQLPVYRLIQEIVNNALKHAKAGEIRISLKMEQSMQLKISDNGVGFDVDLIKQDIDKGVGLYNIENRVNMLGGRIELTSSPGEGTEYRIELHSNE